MRGARRLPTNSAARFSRRASMSKANCAACINPVHCFVSDPYVDSTGQSIRRNSLCSLAPYARYDSALRALGLLPGFHFTPSGLPDFFLRAHHSLKRPFENPIFRTGSWMRKYCLYHWPSMVSISFVSGSSISSPSLKTRYLSAPPSESLTT